MGYIKIISAILIWSSLGVFIRKIGVPNVAIIFYSSAAAGILQLILLLSAGQLKENFRQANRVQRLLLVILIPICTLSNNLLFYYAFLHTTVANSVLAHYTAPIFVALLAPVFLKERSCKTTWIAIVLSSAGLWLMLWMPSAGMNIPLTGSERAGVLAGAASGLAYAFLILMIRALASRYTSLFFIFVQNSMIALFLLPFISGISISSQSLIYLVAMGVVYSTVAPLIYVQGFKSVKANDAAILGYFEPVGATILAFVFFHEVPGITALFGGALILFSGYLILRSKLD
jgi:drug/metabolite transporter (DMT)-like permease